VYYNLSRGTTVGCSAGCCLRRTTTTTSFMHHVAKAHYAGPVLRFDRSVRRVQERVLFRRSRDEDGVVGERNDNRGGREQGIAVGARDGVLTARYERQRTLRCECSSKRACGLAES